MKLNFRQGLVSSEVDGNGKPNYLVGNGTGITLRASNRPIVFTVASGQKDYTIDFYRDVLAWPISMFAGVTSCWLYIDVNRATAQKTYGITTLAPKYGATAPANPSNDQHWFDTANKVTKVYNSAASSWLTVLRVLAGRYTTTTLETQQFGSQVGLTGVSINSGTILTDGFGVALTDSRGQFMTTEDVILVNGAPSYAAKLESNVTVATADQPIAAFHVVKYNNNGKIAPADYDNVGLGVVGITTVGVNATEPVSVVLSGKVHNPAWNWGSANVTLWVGQNGELVAIDPFTLGTRAKQRVPVARSIDAQTIIFDQGLGGVGEKGEDGGAINLRNASATLNGITRLSVNPDNAEIPIAVGINDPILTSPKVPIEHNHAATSITVSPFATFNGTQVQQALEFLQLNKLSTAGGTVTGNIISDVQATLDTHLINMGQVKTLIAANTISYKRMTMSSSQTTLTAAFNNLTSAQRTFPVNTIVMLEWKDTVYLWTGGIGAPVTASNDAQFAMIGKVVVEASLSVIPNALTINEVTS